MDKLATWAAGEPIGEREVAALAAPNADVPIYELTEAWSAREVGRALEISETIFEREPRPRRDTAPRLAGALGSHVEPAARDQAARGGGRPLEGGGRAPEAASRSAPRSCMAQADGFSR